MTDETKEEESNSSNLISNPTVKKGDNIFHSQEKMLFKTCSLHVVSG